MKSVQRHRLHLLAAPLAAAVLSACGSDDDPLPTIVGVAQSRAEFSSLVAALQFAGNDGDLVALLSGTGPFTVFAPTNAAFDALARELTGNAQATAAALLVPANRALLRDVLQYHVVAGRVPRSAVPVGQPIDPALAGDAFFTVNAAAGGLAITDARGRVANITATDVEASNGLIHVIDRVILPPAGTIVQVAQAAAPEFSSLVAALQFASGNLVTLLSGAGPFTVFAPTNAAFDALARELSGNAQATATALLVPGNEQLVSEILQYHVVAGRVPRSAVPVGQPIDPALQRPGSFTVTAPGGTLTITDARGRTATIVTTDVQATNGLIHVIDRVILPPA